MHIKVKTPVQALYFAGRTVVLEGEQTNPRGIATREICNVTIEIEQPWQIPFVLPGRNLRDFIGAVEALQLVGQTITPELVTDHVQGFEKFKNDGIFLGAYGERIYGNLAAVVQKLKEDPDSRQAVLTIFNSDKDLRGKSNDTPCTLTIQFLIRNGNLNMRVSMRSNDVWLGLPYDLVQFAALQGAVAKSLNIPMGWYSHTVGSLHAYENNFTDIIMLGMSDTPNSIPYEPLWGGLDIEQISRTARRILHFTADNTDFTDFEYWLQTSLRN